MLNNKNLGLAKTNKNDEFYTQLSDIEKELIHYKEHFKNKVVYLNCDNPSTSNFWKYLYDNFYELQLGMLMATYYNNGDNSQVALYDGIKTQYASIESGDFRSPECIKFLKQSDIVVSNPPFSLFREYIGQLMEYNKKFLVIGNMNAVTYKDIFGYIKDNKLWLGVSPRSMTFVTPDGLKDANAVWYTNLLHKKRNERLVLYQKYKGNEHLYPKYDNYNAINIDKVKDIPFDYRGVMGVPITFLAKYNPEQFKILGAEKFYKIETSKGVFEMPTHQLENIDRQVFKRLWVKVSELQKPKDKTL
jgi:hypothetical protein